MWATGAFAVATVGIVLITMAICVCISLPRVLVLKSAVPNILEVRVRAICDTSRVIKRYQDVHTCWSVYVIPQ